MAGPLPPQGCEGSRQSQAAAPLEATEAARLRTSAYLNVRFTTFD